MQVRCSVLHVCEGWGECSCLCLWAFVCEYVCLFVNIVYCHLLLTTGASKCDMININEVEAIGYVTSGVPFSSVSQCRQEN